MKEIIETVDLDPDVKRLVGLLLRKHARDHADFGNYNNIGSEMSFVIANRGLVALGFLTEEPKPVDPKK